ncbi:hypothetical protein [Halioxenophilus sp. WMMB6]|uniref:hypothetical protein n=1 Tax=Halioxenophilus sp. WMMB6 TaxID=3073815 RepID=UPI00295E81EF|nr:hypothetical protein [Halioxenophilus sp. WMMB6]
MNVNSDSLPLRFVIHHIHPTSARLRFLLSPLTHIVWPTALPKLSELLDARDSQHCLALHPAQYLKQLSQSLQIDPKLFSIVPEFRQWVDTPGAKLPIYLVKVEQEQPFAAPEGCRWIELPDCFALEGIERLIMRCVYDFLLGHDN